MTGFVAPACGLLGLAVGSFLSVVVHRVPRKESIVAPRSRCPGCAAQLKARDLVPVLSWVVNRARCRACGARVSVRYPLLELVTAGLFAAVGARFGADPVVPAYLVLTAALVAISAVDLERYIVPNRILYPALFIVAPLLVVAAAVDDGWPDLARAAIGGALGFVAMLAIHLVNPAGLGFGDVRLSGLLGVGLGWLGLGHVALGLFLGFLGAAVTGVGLIALGGRSGKDKVPFGPFLAGGAMIAILVGRPILDWYL